METKLEYILTHSYKAEMISYLNSHPEDFDEAIKLALSDKQPYSWRASWILWSCMDENDKRISRYLQNIIEALSTKNDSQLRELMMILQRLEINEDYEGQLFNICLNIWERVDNKPSLRHNAFRLIVKIAKKHPDLCKEVKFLTESQYMDSLSPGVKRAVIKMMKSLSKNNG
jgi:hypothetical protein